MSVIKVALLDDYIGIANPYFSHIRGIQIDEYKDTILPSDEAKLQRLVERLRPYPIILSMRERTPFPRSVLSSLPNLNLIVTTGLRNLAIDITAAKEHNIVVAGASSIRGVQHQALPGHLQPADHEYDATTQQCFALILSLASRIPTDSARLSAGGSGGPWQSGLGFTLSQKTLGLVGLGRLGSHAARTAILGFNMNVVAWSQNLTQEKADETAVKIGVAKGRIKAVSKEELLTTADVVSIHYLLSDRSKGVVDKAGLSLMKRTAILVNTSRGPLIDEDALLQTVKEGKIRGLGLDVYNVEPLPDSSPWRTIKWGQEGRSDVVLSPHMGYGVEEVLHRMYAEQSDTVEKYLKGEPLPDILEA